MRRWGAAIETETAASHWKKVGLTPGGSHKILFGRVQEDTSLEASLAPGAHALCIAAGGETAFDLLLGGAKDVVAIDVNPAQVLLVHLKAAHFRSLSQEEIRSAFLQDARPTFSKLRPKLAAEVVDYFAAHPQTLSNGLARAGAIDGALEKAMKLLQTFVIPRRRMEALLARSDLTIQAEEFRRISKSLRVKIGLRLGFHPALLNRMFGRQLDGRVPPGFGDKLRRDLDTLLTTVPAWDNPYLWLTLLGTYPESAPPGWLTSFGHSRMRQVISRLGLETGDAADWLCSQVEPTLDLVCLSNITDLAGEPERRRLIDSFERALKPGGRVVARSLFDDPIGLDALSGGRLKREPIDDWANRSLICRNVEVYRWSPL